MYKILYYMLLFLSPLLAQNTDWQTYYEKSGFKETPQYRETIDYCLRLANASPMISYTTFGKSPQGRDLPLLIVDKNGNSTVEQVRKTNNIVFLIQAGIHSGEIDGKDAGFTLIRDIVINHRDMELLDHVTLLFMPIFNVDGHERFSAYSRINQNGPEEMGWRVTAQNYNLNRDYLKADSPEMQAWLKLYNTWLPEFFADCHVTDGADYQYPISYSIDQHGVMDSLLVKWVNKDYLPEIVQGMFKKNMPIIDYIWFKDDHDPKSGIQGGVAKPRFSNGYTSLQNRPGLLIETHMLKDYKTRVDATYQLLKQTIVLLNRDHSKLKNYIARVDSLTSNNGLRMEPYSLTFKESKDSTMIDFLGYEYTKEKSDLSGGIWYRYSKNPVTMKIPFFNKTEPDLSVNLPAAYIIPVEWQTVIERLKIHGITFSALKKATKIKVKSYRFFNEKWSTRPYENHHTLTFDQKEYEETREFPEGSAIVPLNQRTAKVIAHILEPKAPDSFIFWGFFDSVFERKEYAESYVMEELARIMLASDEKLKLRFEEKMAADAAFASQPDSVLFWFYKQSPYWDKRINTYPVGKIYDEKVLVDLLK